MLLFTKPSPVHKALGRKAYAELTNRLLRQEGSDLPELSHLEVAEMGLLNIWESKLSPRPQLLALL